MKLRAKHSSLSAIRSLFPSLPFLFKKRAREEGKGISSILRFVEIRSGNRQSHHLASLL